MGGYDVLRQPASVDPSYDYICFSNDFSEDRIGVWKIRKIPSSIVDPARLSRYVKILPHKALPDYDVSVWMDANIMIKDAVFYGYVEDKIESGSIVAQVPHPTRDCVYDDIVQCYKDLRLNLRNARRQYDHLREEGFPAHFGLMENNLIFRRHNAPEVISLSEAWWREYMSYSCRDQFSLMPVYWRNGFIPETLLGIGLNARNVPFLNVQPHPSFIQTASSKGFGRLPLKVRWTWRKLVAWVAFN